MKRHLAILVLAASIAGLAACGSPRAEKADAGTEEAAVDSALHEGTHALGDLGKVGTVRFPTSCDPKVQPDFTRAVALLHSFFYEEARGSSRQSRTRTRNARSPTGASP
jgi:hypothetical protein